MYVKTQPWSTSIYGLSNPWFPSCNNRNLWWVGDNIRITLSSRSYRWCTFLFASDTLREFLFSKFATSVVPNSFTKKRLDYVADIVSNVHSLSSWYHCHQKCHKKRGDEISNEVIKGDDSNTRYRRQRPTW